MLDRTVSDYARRHGLSQTAVEDLRETLAPLIGQNLAKNSLKLHSEKLGFDGTEHAVEVGAQSRKSLRYR